MPKKLAEPEMTSAHSVKILLCYLLEKLDCPVTREQLLEITRDSEVINYFLFSEAMSDLEKVGAVKTDENGKITLEEKGRLGSEYFNKYIPPTFRRKLLSAAYSYFAKLRRDNECHTEIKEQTNGYSVMFSIRDASFALMDISFYAPDKEQADNILTKIRQNPTEFYKNVVKLMLQNPEEEERKIEI